MSIDDNAAAWAVRLDAGTLSAEDQRGLDAWLADDPRHRGAFLRARAGLLLIDRQQGPAEASEDIARATDPAPGRSRFGWKVGGALAAAACVTAVALPWALAPAASRYHTGLGEVRQVALTDGSLAMLDTSSDIRVAYRPTTRAVQIEGGEAWFRVAHDTAKPFLVDAGPVHIQATGTAFAVRREGDAVRVIVSEGSVKIWCDGSSVQRAVSAGNQARIALGGDPGEVEVRALGDARPLAWREGGLALNNMTIAEAAAEFNRYNARKIVVRNPALGQQEMVGYFQLNQPEQFAQSVSQVLHARVSSNGSEIVIDK